MGIFDRIERSIDRGVNTVFSRGNAPLKPLDLVQGLRRECDDHIQVLDRERTLAPNVYTLYLNSRDYEGFDAWKGTLLPELERMVTDHANRQRYIFVGPVSVSLSRDDEVAAGRFETESKTERGAAAPATASARDNSISPILQIDGQQYLLTGEVTVIGRGDSADIILEDTGVSRHHVEFRVLSDGLIVTDLGSTNGTFINGQRIHTPVKLNNGDMVRVGRTLIQIVLQPARNMDW